MLRASPFNDDCQSSRLFATLLGGFFAKYCMVRGKVVCRIWFSVVSFCERNSVENIFFRRKEKEK
jgi:hypothetical protein